MRGGKFKPRKLHVIDGTYRPDRHKPEPKVPDDLPVAPSELDALERKYFMRVRRRLDRLGLATSSDTEMLADLAQRLAEVKRYTDDIREHGRIYADRLGRGDGPAVPEVLGRGRTAMLVGLVEEAAGRHGGERDGNLDEADWVSHQSPHVHAA